jgi:ABC-2 type transport system permease protein
MFKLRATILKDLRILVRDKVGLAMMFLLPIVLAIVITAIQNSTFELVNDNKVPMLMCNKDPGEAGEQLIKAIQKIGMFEIKQVGKEQTEKQITDRMHAKVALVAILIPPNFTAKLSTQAKIISGEALSRLGLPVDSVAVVSGGLDPITIYYHPVLQESFRQSIQGALRSALQLVENKLILKSIYFSLNEKEIPDTLEREIVNNQIPIREIAISRNGSRNIPNATQHNIPAWTIFAMFFVVISLASSVVREKLNGSFLRLRTLPTNFMMALFSKQLTYLCVTLVQVAIIFSIGAWLFPVIGLPKLNLPADLAGLVIVSVISGWCAVSYAICVGVFAQTQEQANGFGAVSIVLLAAIGGIMVPSFAMPGSFQAIMKLSPLHWCLEAYYGLFLEGGKLKDILMNILPLVGISLLLQGFTFYALKRKNLI